MDNSNDLSGIVNTVQELEESRNVFLCENQDLLDNISNIEADLEELENLHRENQAKIDEYEEKLQNLQRENKNLQIAVQTKDMEIAELRGVYREMEDKKRENQNLLKDLNTCQNGMCKLKEYVERLEDTLQEQEANISRNDVTLKQLQQKLADLKRIAEDMSEENTTLARNYEECKKHTEEALMENDRLGDKLRVCELARQKLEECVNKNQAFSKQVKCELVKEQENNRKLQTQIKELETELAANKKLIANLRLEVNSLTEEMEDKHSEFEECNAELKRKTAEFENYKNTITSLKQKIMTNRNHVMTCSHMFGETRSRTHRSKQRCGVQSDMEKTWRKSETRNTCANRAKKPHVSGKKSNKHSMSMC